LFEISAAFDVKSCRTAELCRIKWIGSGNGTAKAAWIEVQELSERHAVNWWCQAMPNTESSLMASAFIDSDNGMESGNYWLQVSNSLILFMHIPHGDKIDTCIGRSRIQQSFILPLQSITALVDS